MVTGDSVATAATVAQAIGLAGPVCPPGKIPEIVSPNQFAVYADVFPEDKFRLVKAFQRNGHAVGMCGDGANDAPALRQAQMGIAVSTATDVAKSAAGMVLTEPGLAGIVTAVEEGRATFQRVLTYTLNTLIKKFELVLFLGIGLLMTHEALLTPMLMALLLVTGDFITMSLTTDKVRPSPKPDVWRIRRITLIAIVLGLAKLAFSVAILAVGVYWLGLAASELQTLAFVALIFGGQATVYVVRERRRMVRSLPGTWLVVSSLVDVAFAMLLASAGILMAPIHPILIISVLALTVIFAAFLDIIKILTLRAVPIAESGT
jgi:H+-transporting ATPase